MKGKSKKILVLLKVIFFLNLSLTKAPFEEYFFFCLEGF